MEKSPSSKLPSKGQRELIDQNLRMLQEGSNACTRTCGAIGLAEFDFIETSAALATAWETEKDPAAKAQMLESLRQHKNAVAKALRLTIEEIISKPCK